jgi:ABC-type transporter Mla MlaB component
METIPRTGRDSSVDVEGANLAAAEAWSTSVRAPAGEVQPRGVGRDSRSSLLVAPTRLVAETRVVFRRDALAFVEEAARLGRTSIDLDVGQTAEIDAGGLGILVLVQRRARVHGMSTRLLHAREQVRRLLTLTKLDYLFEFVD